VTDSKSKEPEWLVEKKRKLQEIQEIKQQALRDLNENKSKKRELVQEEEQQGSGG